ncbi:hypothetical protein [Zavarzinella formosa]|uniref:hypothetical protein n=1 Tax=Zavarzinella formosa TaxID=360055 RepID=UPI00037410F1|nr:hypothetical protein [Zavarzinella formosa]
MTEMEWLAATNQIPMMTFLDGKGSDRKLRLFFCWLARQLPELMANDISRHGVEAAEQYADGLLCDRERETERLVLQDRVKLLVEEECFDMAAIVREAKLRLSQRPKWFFHYPGWGQAPHSPHVIRDIFGNPFRPIIIKPSWLTPDVLGLAEGIYDEKAFARLPILADALEDAGCDNEDILSHCRDGGPHVRGCWVVDLVLGKS